MADSLSVINQYEQMSGTNEMLDSLTNGIGANLFEDEVDDVLFMTNQFLTDPTFLGDGGPFWWILQISLCLAGLFSLSVGFVMYVKMMKGEPLDPLKILRVIAIACVMSFWYGNSGEVSISADYSSGYQNDGGVLDVLAYIPNTIGSFTHDLYEIEQKSVEAKFQRITPLLQNVCNSTMEYTGKLVGAKDGVLATLPEGGVSGNEETVKQSEKATGYAYQALAAAFMVLFDKIIFFLGLLLYRVGFWGTIFCQQVLLGMLTIFGPIQWAFSILPKWEGAWAKWITRYLTVHFYGAMLYFVGFYVLLLYDIVLELQLEQLQAIDSGKIEGYLKAFFFTSGYLLVASIVALRCLNLVPDLAAWMIPEGDTAFSTRNFGEGVSQSLQQTGTKMLRL